MNCFRKIQIFSLNYLWNLRKFYKPLWDSCFSTKEKMNSYLKDISRLNSLFVLHLCPSLEKVCLSFFFSFKTDRLPQIAPYLDVSGIWKLNCSKFSYKWTLQSFLVSQKGQIELLQLRLPPDIHYMFAFSLITFLHVLLSCAPIGPSFSFSRLNCKNFSLTFTKINDFSFLINPTAYASSCHYIMLINLSPSSRPETQRMIFCHVNSWLINIWY